MESPRKLHSICQINFTIERINKVSRGNFTQHLFFFCLHFIGRENIEGNGSKKKKV